MCAALREGETRWRRRASSSLTPRFARTSHARNPRPSFACSYVAGEFVGGCDITTQMHQSGELAKLLEEKVKKAAA